MVEQVLANFLGSRNGWKGSKPQKSKNQISVKQDFSRTPVRTETCQSVDLCNLAGSTFYNGTKP